MKISKLLTALLMTAVGSVAQATVTSVDLNGDGNIHHLGATAYYTDEAVFLDADNQLLWSNSTVAGYTDADMRTFAQGESFVAGLTLESLGGWKIPTMEEFAKLYIEQGSTQIGGMKIDPFNGYSSANGAGYVWTSTTDANHQGQHLAFARNAVVLNPTFATVTASIGPNGVFKWLPDSMELRVWANRGAVSPIPEPETYAMLLAGLGVMGALARRRQNKQA